jgi:hypothetical protein
MFLTVTIGCVVAIPGVSGAAGRQYSANVTAGFVSAALATNHPAVSYDQARVPLGSRVQVVQFRQNKAGDAGNVFVETLRVWGLDPHARYFAYAYANACGSTPGVAGTRVQDGPSRTHYAQNEIWLGFRTNAHGVATSSTSQYWLSSGHAKSILISAQPTSQPVACVSVALE